MVDLLTSGTVEALLGYLDDVLIVLIAVPLVIVVSVVLRRVVRHYVGGVAPGVAGFFATLAQVLALLAGAAVVIYVSGVSAAVLLTVVAILSAGVSLALDHSVQDAIAGMKILIFGYVKTGDYVQLLNSHEGTVIATDLFTVTLRTRERDAVIMPNRDVVGSVVVNKSLIAGQAVDAVVRLQRPYDREMAMRAMEAVARDVDREYGEKIFDPEVRLLEVEMVDQWRVRVYVADDMSASMAKHILLFTLAGYLEEQGFVVGAPGREVVMPAGSFMPMGGPAAPLAAAAPVSSAPSPSSLSSPSLSSPSLSSPSLSSPSSLNTDRAV